MPSTSDAGPLRARILGPRDQSPRRLRARIQLLLTLALLGNNSLGAAVVFAINTWVVPSPPPSRASLLTLVVAVPTYVVAAAAIADDCERAPRVPLQLTLMQFAPRLGGSALFTVLALVQQPSRAVSTGLTVALGAMVVAGVTYLESEFALRRWPRALDDTTSSQRLRGLGVGPRMVIFWMLGTAAPVVGLASPRCSRWPATPPQSDSSPSSRSWCAASYPSSASS